MMKKEPLIRLQQLPVRTPLNYFSGGISTPLPVIPENVIAWFGKIGREKRRDYLHQRMVLKVILTGTAVNFIEGVPFRTEAGKANLFFPYELHFSINEGAEECTYLAVTFTLNDPAGYSFLSPLRNRLIDITEKDSVLLAKVVSACRKDGGVSPAAGIAALMEFLAGKREKAEVRPNTLPQPDSVPELFSRIVAYICRNFHKGISLKTVSSDFHVSEQTVRRVFLRSGCGCTPGFLIQELRLSRAQELLRNTTLSIAGIAGKCGFGDLYVFSKAFKRRMKIAPLRYRRNGK